MNKANGFIVLHRKILDWEWWEDMNTFRLFIYLLLTANHESGRFSGSVVNRGQLVTSLHSLAEGTGLTIRQTRTSLEHLISTGEVTNESSNQNRVITIVNYDKYQKSDKRSGRQSTSDRQTKRQTERQQYNNINNINNENNETNKPLTGFVAPAPEDVAAYCQEKGLQVDAERFCDYYGSQGWRVGKNPMKDWRAAVRNWARKDREAPVLRPVPREDRLPAQQYEQRDYSDEQRKAMERMMTLEF